MGEEKSPIDEKSPPELGDCGSPPSYAVLQQHARERTRESARDWSNEALSVRIPRPRDGRIHHDNESALSTSASASLAVRDDDDDYDDDDDDDDILVLVEELIELGVGLQ